MFELTSVPNTEKQEPRFLIVHINKLTCDAFTSFLRVMLTRATYRVDGEYRYHLVPRLFSSRLTLIQQDRLLGGTLR